MTKEEYEIAKEKSVRYQHLDYEYTKVNDAIKNIKKYNNIVLDTNMAAPRVNIGINSQIRDDLTTLLENYKTYIAGQMEEL